VLRRLFALVAALLLVASAFAAPVAAADPTSNAPGVEFSTQGKTSTPTKPSRPITPQSQAFCGATAVTVRLSSIAVGSQGFESCTGGVVVMKMTVTLEHCDVYFFTCIHWATIRTYAKCSHFGAGSFSCPASGTYVAFPGSGTYRTGLFAEVQDTSGGYGSGMTWGAEVNLDG